MEYSAGYILMNDNKYLLIKNKQHQEWGFPKGHLEAGEDNITAADRELFEETGLLAKKIVGFKEQVKFFIKKKQNWKTVTYYLGKAKSLNIKLQAAEIDEYHWCNYKEAIQLLPFNDIKALFKKAHTFIEQQNLP